MAWFGGFFGGAGGNVGGSEMVGQYLDLGQQRLRIKKIIAEGGYGFVFVAQDTSSGKEYALKRLMAADESTKKHIVKEVSNIRKLRGHPNIVQYIGAASGPEKQSSGVTEYLILTELCSGGRLLDFINQQGGKGLSFEQVLKVFAQTCRAVAHMHKQVPPMIHRDLKIENVLLSSKGVVKVCDFGSSTTTSLYPDDTWSALQRSTAEDEIQVNTTPMYRAPEMIDLYSNHPVTTKADVWALGCILYTLCFNVHPFEDSAKLKILNANYTIPEGDKVFTQFHELTRAMLKVNPLERPDVEDVYAELVSIATDHNIDLKQPIIGKKIVSTPETEQPPERTETVAAPGNSSLGSMVNRASNIFSNIKDASSKMIHSVAGYVNSDLDISYVTSKMIVMSFPAEGIEATYKNNIDDVRTFLDSKHPDNYVVVNISQRKYRNDRLNDKVFECGWNPKRTPTFEKLVSLCRKLNNFLKQNKKNVIVIHCLDGRTASALLLCSFFMFCKLFTNTSTCEHLFNLKRCGTANPVDLSPSQRRYIEYVAQIVATPRYLPHKNTIFMKSFAMSHVPIFNKARTGCRPFIEVYENGTRILNTAQEIEQMREYTIQDGRVTFQTHVRLNGDILIQVHHGRSTLGGKVQGKLTSINILTLQFHTGFMAKDVTVLTYPLSELDIQEVNADRYHANFSVAMSLKFTNELAEGSYTQPYEKINVDKLTPYVCFSSKEEYWVLHEEFGLSEEKTRHCKKLLPGPTTPVSPTISSPGTSKKPPSFFDNINWKENTGDEMVKDSPGDSPSGQDMLNIVESSDVPNSDDVSEKQNQEISNNLIDISSGPKPTLYHTPSEDSSPRDDQLPPPIELVDPFQDMTTTSPEPTGLLLRLDSNSQMDCDLITSANISKKQMSPDLLHHSHLKRNKSLDDINNDAEFFKSLNGGLIEVGSPPKSTIKSSSDSNLFDWGGESLTTETLLPEKPIIHASSSGNIPASTPAPVYDPFADFGNVTSTNASNFLNHSSPLKQPQLSKAGMNSPVFNRQTRQNQPMKPNYNVYMEAYGTSSKNSWAPKPTVTDSTFSDILGAQGFKASNSEQQKNTLKQMKREQEVDANVDPIQLKIRDWSDGKERNIRALLTSLPTVLWEGCAWSPVAMHELIQPGKVKKKYRKACLAIHPDKHVGEPHEDLARAIFIEMNEAWSIFEESDALF